VVEVKTIQEKLSDLCFGDAPESIKIYFIFWWLNYRFYSD